MSDTSNLITVSGAQGTGTSLVLAMLNARRDIFVMYEVCPYYAKRTKYAQSFLEAFPDLAPLFADHSLTPLERYGRMQAALRAHGYPYRYFGDKVPTVEVGELTKLAQAPYFIFTVRDLRTWLCREKIFRRPHVVSDVVPMVRAYLLLFLKALATEHALLLRMEDCVLQNEKAVAQLVDYLQLPDGKWIRRWWSHVVPREDDRPKKACRWFGLSNEGRPRRASANRPAAIDVEYVQKAHPLWERVLPLFDQYFAEPQPGRLSAAELKAERRRVDEALKGQRASLTDLFESFTSWSVTVDESGRPARRNVWRLTADGRLLRPPKGEAARPLRRSRADAIGALQAARPVFLMLEEEDEPVAAVTHWNIFDAQRFQRLVEQSGMEVVALSHEEGRSLLPSLGDELRPPHPHYLYRFPGNSGWQTLAADISLDSLCAQLQSAHAKWVMQAKQKALVKAKEGVALLNRLGFRYELRERGRKVKA